MKQYYSFSTSLMFFLFSLLFEYKVYKHLKKPLYQYVVSPFRDAPFICFRFSPLNCLFFTVRAIFIITSIIIKFLTYYKCHLGLVFTLNLSKKYYRILKVMHLYNVAYYSLGTKYSNSWEIWEIRNSLCYNAASLSSHNEIQPGY